jgi:hypothetical protein
LHWGNKVKYAIILLALATGTAGAEEKLFGSERFVPSAKRLDPFSHLYCLGNS